MKGTASRETARRRRTVMRIEQKYVDIAIEHTEKEAREHSVVFGSKDIEEFKRTLKGIAEVSKYTEGQEMSKDDIATIAKGMDKVFDGVAQSFAQMDDAFKKKTDLSHYSILAYKHLIALAMKELNSPEVHEYAFYGSVSALARKISREKPAAKNITVEDTHKQQRRMDAKDVIKMRGVDYYMKHIKEGFERPDEIGQLYAEYRALSIRQENHTGFWRFFHRGENEERTNLLREMENTLKMVLPEDMLAEKPSAKEIMQYCDWKQTKMFIPQFMNTSSPSQFGYYDHKNNPEMYDAWKRDFDKKQKKSLNEQLANDVNGKDEEKVDKIPEEPKLTSPTKSIS